MVQLFDSNKSPDFIGDIHGYLEDLERLFLKLGYTKSDGIYIHPTRIPIFLGDYINRGPDILGVLDLVKKMHESGNAFAIMGNHEFNFLAFHYYDENGVHFRENTPKYLGYLNETKAPLEEVGRLNEFLDWMSLLPLIVKNEYFNAVHAEWNQEIENNLKFSGIKRLNQEGMRLIHKDEKLLKSVASALKGSEFQITDAFIKKYDFCFSQKTERIKWWKKNRSNFIQDWLVVGIENEGVVINPNDFDVVKLYDFTSKPTFFGHYWFSESDFGLIDEKLCCLDFSVAKKGFIGAYRFENELFLNESKLYRS